MLLLDEQTLRQLRRDCEDLVGIENETSFRRHDFTECSGGLQAGVLDVLVFCDTGDWQ